MAIVFEPDADSADVLRRVVGAESPVVDNLAALRRLMMDAPDDLVVAGPGVDAAQAMTFAADQRVDRPAAGVVLVQRRVDSTMLGDALRSGVREVVKADDLARLDEACRASLALSAQVRRREGSSTTGRRQGQLVTVFAAKGGCGKTTLSTNLAAALAQRKGTRVCLVDLDLQFGDVGITMSLRPEHTSGDIVGLRSIDDALVQSLVSAHSEGLDVVLAPVDPAAADRISADLVGQLLDVLKGMYDVVVVDSPPAFTEQVLAAFDRTDHFALIATLDVTAVKSLKLTLDTLDLLSYPKQARHIVLNRADSKVGLTAKDVEQTVGTPVAVSIPSSRAVPAAANRGVTLVLDEPRHAVSAAVRVLADVVLAAVPGAAEEAAAPSRRRLSLLRRAEVAS